MDSRIKRILQQPPHENTIMDIPREALAQLLHSLGWPLGNENIARSGWSKHTLLNRTALQNLKEGAVLEAVGQTPEHSR